MIIQGIYLIRNKINDKMYIGQSIDIYRRWKEHLNFKKNNKSKYPLYHSFSKYGTENFDFIILEEVKDEGKLLEREMFWYERLIPEYNLTIPSENGGKKTKEVYMMDEDGNILNKFNSVKDAGLFLGKPMNHISAVCRGERNRSLGYLWSFVDNFNTTKKKTRTYRFKVLKIDPKTNEVLEKYPSLSEAARQINGSHTNISLVCKGVYKQYLGFKWKFDE